MKPGEPLLTPGWEGFVVLDARGRIVCWPNSTPKLYHSPEQASKSLAEGETLAPISFRPTAFVAKSPAPGTIAQRVERLARGFGVPPENVVRAIETIRPKAAEPAKTVRTSPPRRICGGCGDPLPIRRGRAPKRCEKCRRAA